MKHVLWVFYGFKNVTREYCLSGYLPRKEDRRLRSLESSAILKYKWKLKITNKGLKGLVVCAFTVEDVYFAGLFSLRYVYVTASARSKDPLDMEPHPLKYYSVHQPQDKKGNVLTSELIISTRKARLGKFSLVFSNVFSILFVACMVSVRKERGTEFGRETTREGEEKKRTFPRAALFSPSRQLVMYAKLRQPWTSSCSLPFTFPSRARNPVPLPCPFAFKRLPARGLFSSPNDLFGWLMAK